MEAPTIHTAKPFDISARFYDLFYKDKDYFAEADFVSHLIRKQNPSARKLLELGCGSGNYSLPLIDLGYEIVGLDLSPEMISRAQAKAKHQFTGVVTDIAAFELDTNFDGAVALFHVISYLTETDKVLSCLKHVQRHLLPGALFIFDVWFTPAVCYLQPERRVKSMFDHDVEITRTAIPRSCDEKNIVEVHYHFEMKDATNLQRQTAEETHVMRHFSTPEISLLARLAGLEFIGATEMVTDARPSKNTWGVCYILQKKHENNSGQ